MRKILAAAACVGLAGLTACSVSAPAPEAASTMPAQSEPATAQPARPSGDADSGTAAPPSSAAGGARATGTREACQLFNKLVVDYGAVSPTDSNGYEDVYLKAQDATDAVSGDLRGLFSSLGLLALDRSSAAESGGKPAQESQDAVRDAVFANSGACTAAGVTLRL
ncbi:hypothetical protein QF031_001040 [Pseudarthrobacter defluvii]|uniref:hypothetical protein n=1 Tax=Pseudarthrobacter defluvii TaxID=410837 RepID=UPI00277E5F3C|nr:hypothetical protein [Pseudarthrobacter defluvii]MDQ0768291.1 hypothetical protein [Pseudarthrobacter defluvii]